MAPSSLVADESYHAAAAFPRWSAATTAFWGLATVFSVCAEAQVADPAGRTRAFTLVPSMSTRIALSCASKTSGHSLRLDAFADERSGSGPPAAKVLPSVPTSVVWSDYVQQTEALSIQATAVRPCESTA